MTYINKSRVLFALIFIEIFLEIFNVAEIISGANIYVYVTIFVQAVLIFHMVEILKNNNNYFGSPAFLFSLVTLVYSVLGMIVFLVRDFFGFGMGGNPVDPVNFFRRFSYIAYLMFIFSINNKFFYKKNLSYKNSMTRYFKAKLFVIFILSLIGIYILTSGFSQVAVFSNNPDEVRYANRNNSNVAIGSLFVLFGVHAIVIIADLVERKIISKLSFALLFAIYYVPFVLSASRLLMLLPFISIILLKTQYARRVNAKNIAFSILLIIAAAYIFGAYRSQGTLQNAGGIMQFLQTDFFPEFSGTVYTQTVIGVKNFITPLSTVFGGVLPNSLATFLGIDKSEYFQLAGAILGEIWNSQYSIRISLAGELFYAEYEQLIIYLALLMLFVGFINYKVLIKPGRYRHVYVMTGLLVSLSIPYGAQFMVITLHFFVFSLLFFRIFDMFSISNDSKNVGI